MAKKQKISTTWLERFQAAIAQLCNGNIPPFALCEEWNKQSESLELQDWVINHSGLKWAQDIAILDAAQMLANQPIESEDHAPYEYEQEDVCVTFRAREFEKYYSPIKNADWLFGIIPDYQKIYHCIETNQLIDSDLVQDLNSYNHAARIAYFVLNPPTEPIEIEMSSQGYITVYGNHELFAAIFANRYIEAVLSGCIEALESILNIKIQKV